jgi:Na+/H+-dicarboxylate symporter
MAPPSNTQESSPSISGSSHTLSWAIIAGLVGGVIAGEGLFHYFNGAVPASILDTASFIGNTLFINLLKMVLIPLVASSVVVAICSIGSPAQLGRLGVIAFLFYISTMLIAATIGVLLVVSIAPGTGVGESLLSTAHSSSITAVVNSMSNSNNSTGLWMALQNITQHLIPTNPFAAAVNGDLLSVISVSIILGTTLIFVGDVGSPLRSLFNSLFAVCMLAISWILYLAPIGIFFLVTWTIGRIGIASLVGPLSKYIATVTLGLGLHALFVLPTILFLVTRINPFSFLFKIRTALLTAFTTDSSSATLPVSIRAAEKEGGISPHVAGFVLPLGATMNMDGTALYEAVAVIFLFQCYGIELHTFQLAIVVLTATLAAIGAAGIPSAGLVTMAIVIEAVNQSLGLSGAQALPLSAAAIILGIDRIMDMMRTTVNVWGDLVGAKIVDCLLKR